MLAYYPNIPNIEVVGKVALPWKMTSFDPSPFGSLESPLKMDLDIQGCDPSNGNAILDKGSTFQRCDKAAHTDGVQTRAALPRETACYICFHHVGTHASWISRTSKMGGIFFYPSGNSPALLQWFSRRNKAPCLRHGNFPAAPLFFGPRRVTIKKCIMKNKSTLW